MKDDPREIAKGLTKVQRDAVCGKYSWKSPEDEWWGEAAMYRLGIWRIGYIKRGESILTDFGQQVRAILEESND